mmetsp:Transcript_15903/g.20252  ORF Transcript_15903/g.20252 Transcript_15903/m.20252 type:complete len:90 (+) Transcript_15903:7-276(+)
MKSSRTRPNRTAKNKRTPKAKKNYGDPEKTVDFSLLEVDTLKRYKRHYKLRGRNKSELVAMASKHFETINVNEFEVINNFIILLKQNSL